MANTPPFTTVPQNAHRQRRPGTGYCRKSFGFQGRAVSLSPHFVTGGISPSSAAVAIKRTSSSRLGVEQDNYGEYPLQQGWEEDGTDTDEEVEVEYDGDEEDLEGEESDGPTEDDGAERSVQFHQGGTEIADDFNNERDVEMKMEKGIAAGNRDESEEGEDIDGFTEMHAEGGVEVEVEDVAGARDIPVDDRNVKMEKETKTPASKGTPKITAEVARRRCTPCKWFANKQCSEGTPCTECVSEWTKRNMTWPCIYQPEFVRPSKNYVLPDIYRMKKYKQTGRTGKGAEEAASITPAQPSASARRASLQPPEQCRNSTGSGPLTPSSNLGTTTIKAKTSIPSPAYISSSVGNHVVSPKPNLHIHGADHLTAPSTRSTEHATASPSHQPTSTSPIPSAHLPSLATISSVRDLVSTLQAELASCRMMISTWSGDGVRVLAKQRAERLEEHLNDPLLLKYLEQEECIPALSEAFKSAVLKANLEDCLGAGNWLGARV